MKRKVLTFMLVLCVVVTAWTTNVQAAEDSNMSAEKIIGGGEEVVEFINKTAAELSSDKKGGAWIEWLLADKEYYDDILDAIREDRENSDYYYEVLGIDENSIEDEVIIVFGNPFYVIQKGDTLSEICEEYGISVEQVLRHNKFIKDPNKIYYSDTIRLWTPTRKFKQ